jgi:(p)ppGpp synthase/HD superfamily hydrolase
MGLEGVYDMVALRVVCTPLYADKEASSASSATLPVSPPTPATLEARADLDKQICDYVLREVVHKLRPHYKGRVKDYVGEGNRKDNGYQSLHTTLAYRLRGETTPVEIQIRTSEMHSVAEHGLAAHCLYKGDRTLAEVIERGQQQAEQQMQEEEDAVGPQRGFAGPGEFLTWCQKMLDKSHVIVFSPDGKLLKLNRGATLLDFVKASCLQPKAGTAQGKRGTRNKRVEEGRGRSRLHPQGLWRDNTAHEEHGGYQTVPVSRRKSKRSTQGMLLLNGQSAPALDRVLVTGDVISYM